MRRIGALTAILLTVSAYAQDIPQDEPAMAPMVYGVITVPVDDDGGTIEQHVGPGLYLNDPAMLKVARTMEALKAENASLKKSLDETPPPSTNLYLVIGVGIVCLLAGGYAGAKVLR